MARRLEGKVCIITGSGGAIGRASALRFAEEGARVVGCDVNEDAAAQTVAQVHAAGGEMVSLHPCELTDPAQCAALIAFAVEHYGQIDVLFNNAGRARFGWIEELKHAEWQETIDKELTIVFVLTQAAWPELIKTSGTVVNTASTAGWLTFEVLGGLAHCAAKGGVIAMTRQLALEGRTHGIRANSISPGTIETPSSVKLMENPVWRDAMLKKVMRGSLGKPVEVANVALFLASDESSFVNAADIIVDGGTTAW